MSQENPFPDLVPKVGDVVRIERAVKSRAIREATVIEREAGLDGTGKIRSFSIWVRVGGGAVRNPQEIVALKYNWNDQHKTWETLVPGRPTSVFREEDSYKITIVKKAP